MLKALSRPKSTRDVHSKSIHLSSSARDASVSVATSVDDVPQLDAPFGKRAPRSTKYDDVCMFKAPIVYDDVKNLQKLEAFLQAGGDPNYVPVACGLYDWTLLHWAALYKAQPSVKLLIAKGGNPKLRNAEGQTARDIASSVNASAEILNLLPHSGSAAAAPPSTPTSSKGTLRR